MLYVLFVNLLKVLLLGIGIWWLRIRNRVWCLKIRGEERKRGISFRKRNEFCSHFTLEIIGTRDGASILVRKLHKNELWNQMDKTFIAEELV